MDNDWRKLNQIRDNQNLKNLPPIILSITFLYKFYFPTRNKPLSKNKIFLNKMKRFGIGFGRFFFKLLQNI